MKEKPVMIFNPRNLSDESAHDLCLFLNEFVMALENHYLVQLKRYSQNLEQEKECCWYDYDLSNEEVPF